MIKKLLKICDRLISTCTPIFKDFLLELMPKGSICVEMGVHKGNFSKMISKIVNPNVLHLIDPWKYETGESYKFACYGGIANSQEAMS